MVAGGLPNVLVTARLRSLSGIELENGPGSRMPFYAGSCGTRATNVVFPGSLPKPCQLTDPPQGRQCAYSFSGGMAT
jgi:hypothetical protein